MKTSRRVDMMSMNLGDIMTREVVKVLYPASMVGVLGELYFRTRYEMECPRGAVSYHISTVFFQFMEY